MPWREPLRPQTPQFAATSPSDSFSSLPVEPPSPGSPAPLLRVITFGGFEAFADGRPLVFKRAKAKELLALLIDKRGMGITLREGCAYLWPDDPFSNAKRSYYQSMVSTLRTTLAQVGADGILVKSWNSLAINPTLIDCDVYRFLEGDPAAVNSYRHDYLPQYEWAEFSVPTLNERAAR